MVLSFQYIIWHRWFSGRMLACHAGGPGSIPGRCKVFEAFPQKDAKKKNSGDAGYRSPYLSHAKRALYHLSYVPKLVNARPQVLCVSGSLGMGQIPAIFIQHVLAFDSSVGRAVDCSCSKSDIHRSLVQIRLEGVFANSLG